MRARWDFIASVRCAWVRWGEKVPNVGGGAQTIYTLCCTKTRAVKEVVAAKMFKLDGLPKEERSWLEYLKTQPEWGWKKICESLTAKEIEISRRKCGENNALNQGKHAEILLTNGKGMGGARTAPLNHGIRLKISQSHPSRGARSDEEVPRLKNDRSIEQILDVDLRR